MQDLQTVALEDDNAVHWQSTIGLPMPNHSPSPHGRDLWATWWLIWIIVPALSPVDNQGMQETSRHTGWGCIGVMVLFFAGISAAATWPLLEKDPSLFFQIVLGTGLGAGLIGWNSDRRMRRQRSTWLELATELGWTETLTQNHERAIQGNFEGFQVRAHYGRVGRYDSTWLTLDLNRPLRGELTIAGKETTWGMGFLDVSLGDQYFDDNYGFKGSLDGETIQRIFSTEMRARLDRTRSEPARLLTGQGIPLIEVSGTQIVYRVAGRLADKQKFRDHLEALTTLARQCELYLAES